MNTAVRALSHSHTEDLTRATPTFTTQKLGFGTFLLMLAVLLSGLAVIYLADLNRRLAIELEEAVSSQNQLHLDGDKLLLEQSTWATQARIQNIASQQLGMQPPSSKQIIIVKMNASAIPAKTARLASLF